MKNSISLVLGVLCISAMACQPLEASPKRESKTGLSGCVAAVDAWGLTLKHDIASFMGVSLERMPPLLCQRLAEGVRSGRISYSDINRIQSDRSTEFWLVIKGKTKPTTTRAPAPRARNFRNCNGVDGAFQVPLSQKCPLSGYAHSEIGTGGKGKSRAVARQAPAWTRKFRTCKGIDGSYQIPVSRKCPLSGYARD